MNALGEINGFRQVAQVFTSIQSPGPAAANNIFTTLRAEGVIGVPTPTRQIQASDLLQFGIQPTHSGPRPPFSVLFYISPDYVNPYSQLTSLGVQHEIVLRVGNLGDWSLCTHAKNYPRARYQPASRAGKSTVGDSRLVRSVLRGSAARPIEYL